PTTTRLSPLSLHDALPIYVRLWKGDSRGHWDGDTLVVETANFSNNNAFRGSSENLKLTERFRRLDADTLLYQFTVEDPATWDRRSEEHTSELQSLAYLVCR